VIAGPDGIGTEGRDSSWNHERPADLTDQERVAMRERLQELKADRESAVLAKIANLEYGRVDTNLYITYSYRWTSISFGRSP
jgi:hypothetical protein